MAPTLDNPKRLDLPDYLVAILHEMFPGYGRLVLKQEFGSGLSGSRVLLVRPIQVEDSEDRPELPVVVKLAPTALIQKEWQAYQAHIRHRLAGIAEVQGEPVLPPGNDWGGLCYPLLGGGTFEVVSLHQYYRDADLADLEFVLVRLLKVVEQMLRLSQPYPEFHLHASYDRLLPVNLLVIPQSLPAGVTPTVIKPEVLPARPLQPGAYVRLEGFTITEVEPAEQSLTLNLAGSADGPSASYRWRLQGLAAGAAYQVGQLMPAVEGVVIQTRLSRLQAEAEAALGQPLDPTAASLSLPDGQTLPNPLLSVPALLDETRDVKVGRIHGDLNLENILVDPEVRDVNLIDFSEARRDHVLHDFLYLEIEVLTKLVAEVLHQHNLPAGPTVRDFYLQLHRVTFHSNTTRPHLAHPELVKPFTILQTIRQTARRYLVDYHDSSEYYQALALYLLGAMKFRDLSEAPEAPFPKQAAFWGAATLIVLLTAPQLETKMPVDPILPSEVYPRSYPLVTAPRPPDLFVERPAEFDQLITQLLGEVTNSNPKTVPHTIAIQGGGGFGKTTLTQAICHHPKVQAAFPDAILWIELGQNPNLLELLAKQINLLTQERAVFAEDVNAAATHFRKVLSDRRVLVVLDDVWDDTHVRPFLPDNRQCASLLTTRRQDIAAYLGAQTVSVNQMSIDQATDLLLKWLDGPLANLQPIQALAQYLAEWPLLLTLAGAYLRELTQIDRRPLTEAIASLRRRLERKGFTYLDRTNEGARSKAISVNLELSLERLGQRWHKRYLDLAIFPKGTDIPFSTIGKLWRQTADLDELDTEDALRAMQRLSLFTRYDPTQQTIRLHNVICAYLAEQDQDRLPALHHQLLDIHRPARPSALLPDPLASVLTWADLPADEPYLWDHLAYHLAKAGLGSELVRTVKELRYLIVKAYLRGAIAVENDLLSAEAETVSDDSLRLLRRTYVRAGHLLARCDEVKDLAATLYSRMQHLETLADLTRALNRCLPPSTLQLRHPLPDLPHPALIRTLVGHTGYVQDVAISPDGQFIVSASDDATLKVWDTATGQQSHTLIGHRNKVRACAISPNGQFIVSASDDATLKVWDTATGQERYTFSWHHGLVGFCAISPDGKLIVSAISHVLKVWDVETGQERSTLSGHQMRRGQGYGNIRRCAISPDSQFIVSASDDHTLKVWDVELGQERHTLSGHTGPVRSCVISPDGKLIVSASNDRTLKIWDVETGQEQYTLFGHCNKVRACAISPNGQFIVSASNDRTLKVWDVETGQEHFTLSGHGDPVLDCTFSRDGRHIVSASADHTLKVWDTRTGQEFLELVGHTGKVNKCIVTPDNRFIISVSDDKSVKVWDAEPGKQRYTPSGHTSYVRNCVISPNGRFVVSASADKTLKVWDAETAQPHLTLLGHRNNVKGCNISPDGRYIISASSDKTLKVWDAKTGQELRTLSGHTKVARNCTFSPDGMFIVSVASDATVRIWDTTTGETLQTLAGHTDIVWGCDFSSDGMFIVSASSDKTLKVWDAKTGQERHTLKGHTGRVTCCAFNPAGHLIVSASDDKTLKVWDINTGVASHTLIGHLEWVSGCAFSPDGQYIVSSSGDNTVRVWDVQQGSCLATLAVDGPLYGCAWSPDNQFLVAVGGAGVYFLKFVT